MKCPDCEGGFDEEQLVTTKRSVAFHPNGLTGHFCPFCNFKLSTEYTARKNVKECVHSTTDVCGFKHDQECSSCGAEMDLKYNVMGIIEENNAAYYYD